MLLNWRHRCEHRQRQDYCSKLHMPKIQQYCYDQSETWRYLQSKDWWPGTCLSSLL